MFNRKGTKSAMIKLVGQSSSLNVTSEEPDQLVRFILGTVLDSTVVICGLNSLSVFEFCTKLSMDMVKSLG